MWVVWPGPPAPVGVLAGAGRRYADEGRAWWRLGAGAEVHVSPPAWPLDTPIRLLPRAGAPPPAAVTPLPLVQEMMDQVNLPRLLTYANELSGQTPALINGQPYVITTRYTTSGTPVTQAVNYMIERLQRLGLTVSTHTWNASRPPNVIAEKPGLSPGAGIYIICAHLDDMPSSGLAPGADDNGSGSIAVLQAAEILTPYHFDATLRFILFTGEEQGLYGSAAYAQMVQNEDVRGVLNMDMIGRNEEVPAPAPPAAAGGAPQGRGGGGGRFNGLEPQTAESNANALNIIGGVRSPDLRTAINAANGSQKLEIRYRYDNNASQLMRRSDQWPFLQRGVPALGFMTGLHPDYHTVYDRPEKLSLIHISEPTRPY